LGAAKAHAAAVTVEAHLKSDMLDVDKDKTSLQKPNVLFLIEASEVMSFTTKGVQPQVWRDPLYDVHWEETADWKLTKERYGYTIYDINRIMKEATFGMGAMPPAWSGGNLSQGRNLYGRERREKNNFTVKDKDGNVKTNLEDIIELNKNNYYFPFADEEYSKKYLVGAYNQQFTPLEIAYKNDPQVWPDDILPREYKYEQIGRAGYDFTHGPGHNHPDKNDKDNFDGDSVFANYLYYNAVIKSQAYPYALVFKNPQYWTKPHPSPTEPDLVPNDSRMYQTKLVLWNLLSNADRFKDIRIGMATTFLSPANLEREARQRSQHHHEIAWDQNPDSNGIFKVFPFGANIRTKSYFMPENMGGYAYIKDLGTRNSINWSETNIERRKELPIKIKVDQYGFNTVKNSPNGLLYRRVRYENGAMHGPSTGEVEAYFHVHGQHYPLWHNATTHAQYMTPNDDGSEPDGWWSNGAVPEDTNKLNTDTVKMINGRWYEGTKTKTPTNYGDTAKVHVNSIQNMSTYNEKRTQANDPNWHSAGEAWDRPLYKILRRASLWLPIQDADYEWKKGNNSIGQIDKFRLWIDGFADIRSDANIVTDWNESSWAYHSRYLNGARRNSQWYWYNNPEIGVAGMFGLAQAIFPDPTPFDYTPGHTNPKRAMDRHLELNRDYYRERGWIWYSKRDRNIDYTYDYRRASQEYDDTAVPRARFNYGSGEAAGSVLDFFSPKLGYSFTGTEAIRTDDDYVPVTQPQIAESSPSTGKVALGSTISVNTDLHRVSFPIRSTCEDNWLIVVASGAEPKITDKDAYSYNAWEAIKNLYDATNKENKGKPLPNYNSTKPSRGVRKAPYERVTTIKPSVLKNTLIGTERGRPFYRSDFEEIDLDRPIRTLVIGMVASENDEDVIAAGNSVREEVKNMRLNLIKMANAGQASLSGKEIDELNFDNMYDAPIQPYWADDVETLKIAFDAALGAVKAAEEPRNAGGAMPEQRTGSSLEDSKLFSANYQVVYNNQWRGTLRRYLPVVKDGQIVSMDTTGSWELGRELLKKRGSGNAPGGIKPAYWAPDSGSFKEFSQDEASDLKIFGFQNKEDLIPTGVLEPNAAMYQWIAGYDYSYLHNRSFKRAHMLADFGESGLALVTNPNKSADTLPGYRSWAETRPDTNITMLYGQTNDGLLYAVDPESGKPEKIILPPPSLLPMRLASLKTSPGMDGKRVWTEVITEDDESGTKRSFPGFTLDGSLQARNFDFGDASSRDWRQSMLCSLGRGGNGFYMLDVSEHKAPKFSWYRERFKDTIVSMDSSSRFNAPVWLNSSDLTGENAAWLKLGYYGNKPAMGIVLAGDSDNPKTRNIIVAPGGIQEKIDFAKNGGEGAVLLILNPKDGSLIKAFDSNFIENKVSGNWKVGSKAVGVTPYMGMIVSPPVLVASSNTSIEYAGYASGGAYASDNRGNIFLTVMEKASGKPANPSEWSIRTAATLQSKQTGQTGTKSNFAIPHGVTLKKSAGSIWLAGGTANVESNGTITNGEGDIGQMIFSINTPIDPTAQDGTIFRDDLDKLTMRENKQASPEKKGWYIPLDTVAGANAPKAPITADECVTARPVLLGDNLYVPTFTLSKMDLSGIDDICNFSNSGRSGYSRIYVRNFKNGKSALKDEDGKSMPCVQFEGIEITGVTTLRGSDGGTTTIFSYNTLAGDPFDNEETRKFFGELGIERIGPGLMRWKVMPDSPGIPTGKTMIYYWLEK
jgi:hypothetical protein